MVWRVVNGAFFAVRTERGIGMHSHGQSSAYMPMERFRFWGRLIGTDLSSAEEWPGVFEFNDGSEDLAFVGIKGYPTWGVIQT